MLINVRFRSGAASFIRCCLLAFIVCLLRPVLATATHHDASFTQTVDILRQVPCMDEERVVYYQGVLRALNYTKLRAFRVFCRLPGVEAQGAIDSLQRLVFARISYEHLLILEAFAELPGADSGQSWQLLAKLERLDYVSGRAVLSLIQVETISTAEVLDFVQRIEVLNEPAKWAMKAFFELPGQDGPALRAGLRLVELLRDRQSWAVEALCQVAGMDASQALDGMALVVKLSDTDAWNGRALFRQPGMNAPLAGSWLKHYFALPLPGEEVRYFRLEPVERSLLLDSFSAAADYQIWKINNLHAVTDILGQEISAASLARYHARGLTLLFRRLDHVVQERFSGEFQEHLRQGNRNAAVEVLRRATAVARVQVAHDSSSANIYILLARGSELYDSSFRGIFAPVLLERIAAEFDSNLLSFLLAVDPENRYVSDFIIGLAQKGKLTDFFPTASEEQQRVLDLVTESAFQDENSLILFSATFMKLLETIELPSRSYLIGQMLEAVRRQDTLFSTQLRVILQYYLVEYPDLISHVDQIRIKLMMYTQGEISLESYNRPPFGQWKEDGRLSSLSVFHTDDDGSSSYASNARTLLNSGYRPRLSTDYTLPTRSIPPDLDYAAQLIEQVVTSPSRALPRLFNFQRRQPILVDWVKELNGIEIVHSVFVYQGAQRQQELFAQFLKGGHEMFAQRGHSYWRKEQLIDPLLELIKKGIISENDLTRKQRFMSIGSCGGILAYSELAKLFRNHVDILATVGTGKAVINNPYNKLLFEVIAQNGADLTWKDVEQQASGIFRRGLGEDYLQPGSLPAILHKMMDQRQFEKFEHGDN